MPAHIRKIVVQVDETRIEQGQAVNPPTRRAVAMAVIANPYAGGYSRNLDELIAIGEELGALLGQKAVQALGIEPGQAQSYGKAAIVGERGELEHGALWHVPGGYAMRELLGWKGDRVAYTQGRGEDKTGQPGNALSIVPSTKKVGPPGAALDVPLTNINASYVRGQFDAIEVRVPGAPAADEIVFILAMSTGYRVHARVGGLLAENISKWDGLR